MKTKHYLASVTLAWTFLNSFAPSGQCAFTRLVAVAEPKVIASAEPFSASYPADFILKEAPGSRRHGDYASRGLGAKTFVDFDLGLAPRIAAFRHIQRSTPDTIAEANLIFSATPDFRNPIATFPIKHVDEPGAVTFATFPPVAARYVRWQVTSVLPQRSQNLGGHGVEFFAVLGDEAAPESLTLSARTVQVISGSGQSLAQPLKVTLDSPYAETLKGLLRVEGQPARPIELKFGPQTFDFIVAAADHERRLKATVELDGQSVLAREISVHPARKRTIYLLPHSHTDIGYTAIQTDIEEKQINNLLQGLADVRRTANYPAGARFVWNVEVLWAADLFLQRFPAEKRDEFFDAVKRGQIALNGMYLNELTGLCRPEELVRLFRYATQLGDQAGVRVDSAMISDVPGYTWGTVTAMAQAGIRYFSVAPNYFDRIGDILVQWENKPFWWLGPDGQSKVLVWIPFQGYATSHRYGKMSPQFVEEVCDSLEERSYPYDIAYLRWAGHGDNSVPDPVICDFVKDWNATHAWPRFIISSTSEAFKNFEQRYGDQLPKVRGDWTPYWEDGAGSSSAETAMNRASSERLTQAETLWAMLDPKRYPAQRFDAAWKNVLLYSEHTWGAYCSISDPANPFTADQWNIKQSYATTANLQSRQLLTDAAQSGAGFEPLPTNAHLARVDVYNTSSWLRHDLVYLPNELTPSGNAVVTDAQGQPVPCQRLANRELAVLVRDLPPFAGRRLTIANGAKPPPNSSLKATDSTLENEKIRVRLDAKTGGIAELRLAGLDANLADTASGLALNDYLYLIGDQPANLQRNGPVKISVRDRGPLVASLLVESDAPGCHQLRREIRLTAGGDYVELLDTVDKKRLEAASYHASDGKECINFAFPFNVPDGDLYLDLPLGLMRPEADQIPSACKNWLTAGRWAEVANREFGVTWVTLDAPLLQIGGITATLLGSQTNPDVWRKKIDRSQKIYSWAMNNHWGTNYRAYQEGPVQFRFVLRPHRGGPNAAAASRFAIPFSQPLVAVPGRGKAPSAVSLLELSSPDVLVTALKPSDDGKALIARLYNAGPTEQSVTLAWHGPKKLRALRATDTSERPGKTIAGPIAIPSQGLCALRLE